MKSPLEADDCLVVLGSLNAKQEDRTLTRSQVRPVQVLLDGRLETAACFNEMGTLGMSSLAVHPSLELVWLSTGEQLFRWTATHKTLQDATPAGLKDVHEIAIIGGELWIANTGADEVIACDAEDGRVLQRVSLHDLVPSSRQPPGAEEHAGEDWISRFHCNQVFEGPHEELLVLVHHVTGRQLLKRVAQKLLKTHGNGGFINLATGAPLPLGLKAPHSARSLGGGLMVVLDSGRGTANFYDSSWGLKAAAGISGWGRGAAPMSKTGLVYVGVSATRKRYRELIPAGSSQGNSVKALDGDGEVVFELSVPSIDQINNVYILPRELGRKLIRLSASPR